MDQGLRTLSISELLENECFNLGMLMSAVLNESDESNDHCSHNQNVNVSSHCIRADQTDCP